MDIAKEYPFNYPLAPASLKRFASTQLALDLHRHKGFIFTDSTVSWPRDMFKFSCVEILPASTPSNIVELINFRFFSIRNELDTLFGKFRKLNILANLDGGASKCIDRITYGPDSTVSTEATARNLLASDKLNVFEKYMIARVFCFEQDIRKIWPAVFDNFFVNTARENLTMNYSSTGLMVNSGNAGWYCCQLMDRENWTALEYFLANVGDTVVQCNILHDALKCHRFKNIKYVLHKLNKSQVDFILKAGAVSIISELAREVGYYEYVMKIWSHVKESISEDEFFHLLTRLASESIDIRNLRSFDVDVLKMKMILYNIWINAPDRLKNEFIANHAREFFSQLKITELVYEFEKWNFIEKFFSQLLTDMPVESRNKIWIEFWPSFMFIFHLNHFDKWMRFCLANDDIKKFVENEMMNYERSKFYIKYLLFEHKFYDVMKYLNFCSTLCDDGVVLEFKKQIMTDIPSNLDWIHFNYLIDLNLFVAELSTNIDEVNEVFRMIFFSTKVQKILVSKLKEEYAKEVICLTNRYLPNELDVREKEILWEYWIDFLELQCKDLFDVKRWMEFLSWWQSKGDDLSTFKNFLPVDEIFEKLLSEAIPKLGSMEQSEIQISPADKLEAFADVERFLKWYFGNQGEVRNYKSSKIMNYQRMAELKNLLSSDNECIVDDVLGWFFDGDLAEVGNFKDSYERNMLPSF